MSTDPFEVPVLVAVPVAARLLGRGGPPGSRHLSTTVTGGAGQARRTSTALLDAAAIVDRVREDSR